LNEISDSSEDRTILETTQGLCQQLGFKFGPEKVQWAAIDPRAREYSPPMPADQCAFRKNRVYLSRLMRNKLESHEWKPLLASSLIYRYDGRIRLRLNTAPFVMLLGPLLLLTVALIVVTPLLGTGLFAASFVVIIIIVIFVVIFYGGALFARYVRRLWLMADQFAAESIGKESLLSVLQKIDAMNLPEEKRLKRRKNYLVANVYDSNRPSITERIQNLLVKSVTSS